MENQRATHPPDIFKSSKSLLKNNSNQITDLYKYFFSRETVSLTFAADQFYIKTAFISFDYFGSITFQERVHINDH